MYTLLLLVSFLLFANLGMPSSVLGAAWPVMSTDLLASLSDAGVVSFIITVFTVLATVLSDRMIAKFGTHRVVSGAVLLTGLSLLGFSLSGRLFALCLLAAPYGFGVGCVDAGVNGYAALHFKPRHMAFLHCCWGVGSMIGPLILTRCMMSGSAWRGGYRAIAYIQLAVAVIAVLSRPLWKENDSSAQDGAPARSIPETLRLPGAANSCLTFFCYCGMEGTCILWAASYLVSIGFTDERATALAAAYSTGVTIGRFVSGFLGAKLSAKTFVRTGSWITAAAILGLLLFRGQASLVPAFIVMAGVGCAPIYPNLTGLTPERFGRENCRAMVGMQMSSGYIGNLIVPPVFGFIAEKAGLGLYPVFMGLFWGGLLICCRTGLYKKAK